jgi:serine/threonine protein kinase
MVMQFNSQYEIGGSLSYDSQTYVVRQADTDLINALQAKQFCYVLNSRQMGKSSLRVRAMKKLQGAGTACAVIDLTDVGSQGSEENWYGGMVESLVKGLLPEDSFDWRTWWRKKAPLSHVQRWGLFLEEVILTQISTNIVIFIDEIDSVLSLQFSVDDFFAKIRHYYNKRADDPKYNRLTFCLLGVATPSDLIQDRRRTPFNIGQAIEITGFDLNEAGVLAQGILGKAEQPRNTLKAILQWTGGQPFLTQKVCYLVSAYDGIIKANEENERIKEIVHANIIENWENQDNPKHLKEIRDRIIESDKSAENILRLYLRILELGKIPADDSLEQSELRLSGLVVKENSYLKIYNPIYQLVFNAHWAEEALDKLQPQDEAVAEKLSAIRDSLLQHKRCTALLELYQSILQKEAPVEVTPELSFLMNLGLVKRQEDQIQVASRVYANFFNLEWVEQELEKSRQKRIICQRYEVVEHLSNSGGVRTYLVKDLQHPAKTQCILKEISPPNEVGAFAKMHHLFTDAYLKLQQLNTHPNQQVASLLACFDEDDKFYIIQEFIEGGNLDLDITVGRQWQQGEVLNLLIEILEILKFVHDQRLYHLNLKPSNIRRRHKDNKLVLIDFGTLKQISALATRGDLSTVTQLEGTEGYFPHGDAGSKDWSEQEIDIYSAGMIGIFALTGLAPQSLAVDQETGEIIWQFSISDKSGVTVQPQLAAILYRMVTPNPDLAYSSIDQILTELQEFKQHSGSTQVAPQPLGYSKRRILVGCLLGLLATNLGSLMGYRYLQERQNRGQRAAACQLPIVASPDSQIPVDTEVVFLAKQVNQDCAIAIEQGMLSAEELAKAQFHHGKALLLLGMASQQLGQTDQSQQYLAEANQILDLQLKTSYQDPEVHFYKGIAQQLSADSSYDASFRAAIDLYLKVPIAQLGVSQYPILAKLANYLVDSAPGNLSEADFQAADDLYEKATTIKDTSMSLLYNRGVLNHRSNQPSGELNAISILSYAHQQNPQNYYVSKYLTECLISKEQSSNACKGLPLHLTVYSCHQYPLLAFLRLGKSEVDNLCHWHLDS